MTNLSVEEIDEYLEKFLPILYQNDEITIGADLELKCWYIATPTYKVDWFWNSKTLQVLDAKSENYRELFCSPVSGDLSVFCHIDDGAILYSDEQMIDDFVRRLLGMRVFS